MHGIRITAKTQAGALWDSRSGFPQDVTTLKDDFLSALSEHLQRLRNSLGAGAIAAHSLSGSGVYIYLSYTGDPREFTLRIGSRDAVIAQSVDAGGGAWRATFLLQLPVPQVLVNVALPFGVVNEGYTVIALNPRAPSTFAPYESRGELGVRNDPVLILDYNDESWLELTPRYENPFVVGSLLVQPRATILVTTSDGLVSKSTTTAPPSRSSNGYWLEKPLPLFFGMRVSSGHWAYALQHIVQYWYGGENDGRNWDFSNLNTLRRSELAAVNWRLDGTINTGELVNNAAALRGAAVGVRNAKLALFEVRAPRETEPTVASIDASDFRPNENATFEQVEDGLVTQVTILGNTTDIQVVDTVAKERFGPGRSDVKISATGASSARALNGDPVTLAFEVGLPYLRQWGVPVFTVKLPVTANFAHVQLGDFVSASVFNAPDGQGGRGMSAKPLLVVGKSENLATGALDLECLYFQANTSWAPCVRVKSIEGAVITVENAAYLDSITSDYAGSAGGDYRFASTANRDGGASFFQPGFVVELLQRDVESLVSEQFVVTATSIVSGGIGNSTLTLDRSVPDVWTTRELVDVRFARYRASTTEEQKYAFANDVVSRKIDGTGHDAKNWGT